MGWDCRKPVNDQITAISIGRASIQLSMAIKSLGLILDSQLIMNNHVKAVNKASYFHLRALRHIRKSLPDDAKMVACSIIGFCLDYCNSGYARMPETCFAK